MLQKYELYIILPVIVTKNLCYNILWCKNGVELNSTNSVS